MQDLEDKYINELKDNEDFKRLLELKKIIDDKYSKEILEFKTKESKYQEIEEYSKYIDTNKIKEEFIEAKKVLYSKEEVREYFILEQKINKLLNDDFNEIKESISNKFLSSGMFSSHCKK